MENDNLKFKMIINFYLIKIINFNLRLNLLTLNNFTFCSVIFHFDIYILIFLLFRDPEHFLHARHSFQRAQQAVLRHGHHAVFRGDIAHIVFAGATA